MYQFINKKVTKAFIKNLLKVDNVSDCQLATFQSAFVHKSVIERYGPYNVEKVLGVREDYERWEFLGDRVMELVSGEYLHDQTKGNKKFKTPEIIEFEDDSPVKVKFEDDSPHFLTTAKSRMVKKESFARYSEACGFSPFICVVSKEDYLNDDDEKYYENFNNQRIIHSKSIMEDVFEAFIGVCYECFEYKITRDFAQSVILKYADWDKIMNDDNFKAMILRFYSSIGYDKPKYALLKKEREHGSKIMFTACVLCPVPIDNDFYDNKRIFQFQSTDPDSSEKIWIIEKSRPIPKGFIHTGSYGFIAGIGKGLKLKDAEQEASMNAMVNFQALIE